MDKNISNKIEAIEIDGEKFEEYAKARIKFEKKLVGQVIVGLNHVTNTYSLGEIIDRVKYGHEYMIRWCDDTESKQEEQHLFGSFTRRNHHHKNDLVLAMDDEEYVYKPAHVIKHLNKEKQLLVRFIDSEEEAT